MSITLATGTQVAIASTYGTGFTITAISNANPAVATLSAAHGVVVNDLIEITSGWDRLNGRVVRVNRTLWRWGLGDECAAHGRPVSEVFAPLGDDELTFD